MSRKKRKAKMREEAIQNAARLRGRKKHNFDRKGACYYIEFDRAHYYEKLRKTNY